MKLHIHVSGPIEACSGGESVWLNAKEFSLDTHDCGEGTHEVTFFLGDWVEAASLRDALSIMLRRECDRRNAEAVKLQEAEEETAPG